MDILLDTVGFIMIVSDPSRLSPIAQKTYLNTNNRLFLSVVSGWEILLKNQLGKLPLKDKPEKILTEDVVKHNIETIVLDMLDILPLSALPTIHKDPFDRMLICQAKARNMSILTPDPLIRQYKVKTVW